MFLALSVLLFAKAFLAFFYDTSWLIAKPVNDLLLFSALFLSLFFFTVIVVLDIVEIGNYPSVYNPLNSSSFSKRTTFSLYLPFSGETSLIGRLRCGGNLAYNKVSFICCAGGPKTR